MKNVAFTVSLRVPDGAKVSKLRKAVKESIEMIDAADLEVAKVTVTPIKED